MRKNIVKIFIVVVMLLIVFFCIEARALDDTEKFCDVSTESSELGGGRDSSTPLYFEIPDAGIKTGYLYTASFGDKVAFCVDFGKKRGKSYERIGLIDNVTGFNGIKLYSATTVDNMYRVYNWYELNKNSIANARAYAQAAMWVLAESPNVFENDPVAMTKMFVQVAVGAHIQKFVNPINTILRHVCQDCEEKTLGKYIYYRIDEGNEMVLLDAFFEKSYCEKTQTHPTAISECKKWQASYADSSELNLLDFLGDVAARYDNYLQYMNGEVRLRPTYYAYIAPMKTELMNVLDGKFYGWNTYIITEMKSTEKYNGKLYLWCVSGDDPSNPRSQCFVAPEVNDCPKGCVGKLDDIKRDYSFDTMTDEQKNSNIAYKNALNQLYNEYGFTWLQDYINPRCGNPDGTNPSCKPTYESNDCKFNSYDGGFKITDAKDEHDDMNNSCWLEAGISYNYEEDIVSSDTNLGNKYCPVRCWEELESDFPGAVNNIKSGTFFFWGKGNSSDGLLGSINAGRFCQTVEIKYGEFFDDFKRYDNNVLIAYNKYKAQEKFNSQTPTKGEACTLDGVCSKDNPEVEKCTGSIMHDIASCGNAGTSNACRSVNCSSGQIQEGTGCWCYASSVQKVGGGCAECSSGYLSGGKCVIDGHKYSKMQESYTSSNSYIGSNTQYSSDDASTCIADGSNEVSDANTALNKDLSSLKTDLQSAIDERKKATELIRACQSQEFINADNNDLYNFIGKVTLKYSDSAGIDRNLNSSVDLNHVPNENVTNVPGAITGALDLTCAETTGIDGITNLEGCRGDNLVSSKNFTLTKYSHFAWDYNGEFSFYYPREEYFWKVIVENANAVNEKTYNANYSGMNKVPYVVGYGIPTAFSLIEGYYDISIDVEGFGHNGHFSKVMDKENVSVYNYSCPYKVVNELYGNECNWSCDDATETCTLSENSPAYCKREVKGIDLVYRLIEMPNEDKLDVRKKIVFPSIDGDGRNPGDNWSSYITNHQKGFVNITSQKVIYDDEPIYEIELTPTLIGEIREDTLKYRNENKDPYTSYTDYNNQKKIICDGDDPVTRTCASEWLTDYINAGIITGQYAKNGTTEERVEHIANLKHQYE